MGFVQLVRFIRLWRKLGWPIPNVDAAVCGLFRADLAPLTSDDINTIGRLNTGFLTLLPRLGILVRVMASLNLKVKSDLLSLVACWSDIDTHGDTALYRQMFLNPALLQQDAVFADNGYGEFLTDPAKNLAPHAEALRSAFNLTADEYDLIAAPPRVHRRHDPEYGERQRHLSPRMAGAQTEAERARTAAVDRRYRP